MNRTPFIGRNVELNQLTDWSVNDGETRVVAIQARGGMGKTRLLQELKKSLDSASSDARFDDGASGAEQAHSSVVFLDLAEARFQIPLALEHAILKTLLPERMSEFAAARDQYTLLQRDSTSAETLRGLFIVAVGEFLRVVNARPKGFRPVIMIDTVDYPVANSVTFRRFLSFSAMNLLQVTLILSGRQAFSAVADTGLSVEKFELDLAPLKLKDAREFIGYLNLEPNLAQTLVHLAEGRPILLGLVAKWLEYDIPLPELTHVSPDEISGYDTASLAEIRNQFRHALVGGLLRLRDPLDTRILEMAHLEHRYSADIICHLHRVSNEAARTDLANLQDFFFVKKRPEDIFVLHDEMRDLVNQYVWPVVDPLQEERSKLAAQIVHWYDARIAAYQQRSAGMSQTESQLGEIDEGSVSMLLERRSWILRAERIFYLLRHNAQVGGEALIAELGDAVESGHVDFAGLLVETSSPLLDTLDTSQRVEVELLRAEWLRTTGRRRLACEVLDVILAGHDRQDLHRCRLLHKLATVLREDGDAPKGWTVIQESREIARILDDPVEGLIVEISAAEILLALGLVREAADTLKGPARQLEAKGQTAHAAHAYDRYAYALSILGCHGEAVRNARLAIAHGQRLNRNLDKAISLATLGSIMRDGSKFEEAVQSYDEALGYFIEHGDQYWQSAVLMERGLCYLLQYEEERYSPLATVAASYKQFLRNAERDLESSVRLCRDFNRQELPKAVHELGHVYWEQGDSGVARTWWQESLCLAEQAGNLRYILENQIGMCELDIDTGRFEGALVHRQRVAHLQERTAKSHPLLWSRLRKLEAEAHFGLGRYDEALWGYAAAMPDLAHHGGWGRYRLDFELDTLHRNLRSLPQGEAERWLDVLGASWRTRVAQDEAISKERGGLLLGFLEKWQQQEDDHA